MNRENITLIPVIEQSAEAKIVGVITGECITSLYEEAKNR